MQTAPLLLVHEIITCVLAVLPHWPTPLGEECFIRLAFYRLGSNVLFYSFKFLSLKFHRKLFKKIEHKFRNVI